MYALHCNHVMLSRNCGKTVAKEESACSVTIVLYENTIQLVRKMCGVVYYSLKVNEQYRSKPCIQVASIEALNAVCLCCSEV